MSIVGIDLGTSNSLVSVWKNATAQLIPNALGSVLTPSVVSLDDDGTVLVGQSAKDRLIAEPERTATGFKRFMGTDRIFRLGDKAFLPEELSALVLRRLCEDAAAFLGEPATEAVVSVPAYFNDRQRAATKRAGRLAGLKVDRLVNEPSAAALACRMYQPEGDSTNVVFDFGGGTLDVSVVECFENVISVIAVSGDNHLGGNDFDMAIAGRFCADNNLFFERLAPQIQGELLHQAELCKRQLSEQDEGVMNVAGGEAKGRLTLNRQQLVDLCAPLFQRMATPLRRALSDCRTSLNDVNSVILVGGSCNMPVVQEFLRQLLERDVVQPLPPDTVVGTGAGIYAGIKERAEEIREVVLTDLCPFTLGTGVSNDAGGPLLFSPIIERNSVLPISRTQTYYTVSDMQTAICVEAYQGEERYCRDNLLLGDLRVPVPPRPAGEESVDVRFTYDINGILEVETTLNSSGRTWKKVFMGKGVDMTQEEAQERLNALASLKIHPREHEENRALLARAERLYAETVGELRERVGRMYDRFQTTLASQEERKIYHARLAFSRFLDLTEDALRPFEVLPAEMHRLDESEGDWDESGNGSEKPDDPASRQQ